MDKSKKGKTNEKIENVAEERISETTPEVTTKATVRVKFHNTYMGKLGSYIQNRVYEIPEEIYEMLKMDCKEV